jgi:Cd2+/Zn2+-exporting ATPase
MKNDLNLIPKIVRQARKTQNIVRQNLTIALSVILLATTPSILGLIPLWLAVILHEGGTVIVGLNSLRLLRWK